MITKNPANHSSMLGINKVVFCCPFADSWSPCSAEPGPAGMCIPVFSSRANHISFVQSRCFSLWSSVAMAAPVAKSQVWNKDHPISDDGVHQSQELREKILQARPAESGFTQSFKGSRACLVLGGPPKRMVFLLVSLPHHQKRGTLEKGHAQSTLQHFGFRTIVVRWVVRRPLSVRNAIDRTITIESPWPSQGAFDYGEHMYT